MEFTKVAKLKIFEEKKTNYSIFVLTQAGPQIHYSNFIRIRLHQLVVANSITRINPNPFYQDRYLNTGKLFLYKFGLLGCVA